MSSGKRKKLTQKQQSVLNHIIQFRDLYKFSPTMREIADVFGITVKGAFDHVHALEKKGHVVVYMRKSRGIIPADELEVD